LFLRYDRYNGFVLNARTISFGRTICNLGCVWFSDEINLDLGSFASVSLPPAAWVTADGVLKYDRTVHLEFLYSVKTNFLYVVN